MFSRLLRDLDRSKTPLHLGSSTFLCASWFFVWQPPQVGWIKINVDAAVPLDSSAIAIAAIAHDHNGKWIDLGIRKAFGKNSFDAEMEAAFLGLVGG